jgi:hypothetical protein
VIDARFALALAALLALGGLAAWPLVGPLRGGATGLVAGLAFSFTSLVLGLGSLRWGLARSPRHVVMALLGSMAARVVALITFALVLALATRAHLAVALLTVVAAHIIVGWAEVVYLKRTGAFE